MKKLIIEIDAETCLEDGDVDKIIKHAQTCSLFMEFGKPHENQELADEGIAQVFAIDIAQFTVRIEES